MNRTDTIAALTIARKAHRANRTALIECPKGGVERASILRRYNATFSEVGRLQARLDFLDSAR